ncbi:MAG: histidine kinase [Bacteroidia bacterium]
MSRNTLWFLLRHGAFWFVVWLSLALIFATESWSLAPIDRWYAALFIPGLMVMVYAVRFQAVPVLRKQTKPVAIFFILVNVAVGLGFMLNKLTVSLGEKLLDQYYFGEFPEMESVLVNTVVLTLALGLQFSRSWFFQQTKIRDIEQARLQSELRLLRSQLEPHFLFNSLNSLYALALRQDPHTPQAILELAELLRYVQLSSTQKTVNLQEEWDFLLKYKSIQGLRLDRNVQLAFESEGRLETKQIVPLLLINPVENAFKHFQAPLDGRGSIRVFVQLKNNTLSMTVQNSYRPGESGKKPGTGLAHLKKQLLLHYPNKHQIRTEAGTSLFLCEMKIDLS